MMGSHDAYQTSQRGTEAQMVELRVINAKMGVRKEVIFLCFNFLLLSNLHNSIA